MAEYMVNPQWVYDTESNEMVMRGEVWDTTDAMLWVKKGDVERRIEDVVFTPYVAPDPSPEPEA